jgi:hypothetical protein
MGTVFSAFWLDVLLINRPPASRLHSHPHHSLSHWKKIEIEIEIASDLDVRDHTVSW